MFESYFWFGATHYWFPQYIYRLSLIMLKFMFVYGTPILQTKHLSFLFINLWSSKHFWQALNLQPLQTTGLWGKKLQIVQIRSGSISPFWSKTLIFWMHFSFSSSDIIYLLIFKSYKVFIFRSQLAVYILFYNHLNQIN
jgi:hypothetical protein